MPLPEILIPIPLHRKRILKRGFNQASELGRVVSSELQIPIRYNICRRIKNTTSQTHLNESRRRQNLAHAFTVENTADCEHIALIDDVITSGSTVNSLARELLSTGIKQVSVWAIAKT